MYTLDIIKDSPFDIEAFGGRHLEYRGVWAPPQQAQKQQVVTQVRPTFWKLGVVCPSKSSVFRVII